MKKLLLVLVIAGFATACNNDSEKSDAKKDSTTAPVVTPPAPDTTHPAGSDTTAPKM